MTDGLIGHYFGDKYARLSHLESAKQNHKEGIDYQTWDIGVELKDLEKEVKDFYKNNGYSYFIDEVKKSKYTFYLVDNYRDFHDNLKNK
jgi:hypothetical protein